MPFVAGRLAGGFLVVALTIKVRSRQRFASEARYGVGFLDHTAEDTGAAFIRFVEQDDAVLALANAFGRQLRFLELECLLAAALKRVLQRRLQQAAIARAKRMRGRGKSLRYIAGKLALEGYKLNPESVRRLLTR